MRQRQYAHQCWLRNNKHYNKYLQNSWNKHGEGNFQFEVVEECEMSVLLEREQHYIDLLNPTDRRIGFNRSLKVNGGLSSPETKEKFRRSIKAKYESGYVNHFKGKRHSKETRKLIGIKSALKEFPPDFMAALLKASNRACFKPVVQLTLDGKIVRFFDSINIAATETGVWRQRIGKTCKGKARSSGGFRWRYAHQFFMAEPPKKLCGRPRINKSICE